MGWGERNGGVMVQGGGMIKPRKGVGLAALVPTVS